MKLKITLLASPLLSTFIFNAYGAQELTSKQAAAIEPFERISISGRFNSISDVSSAISKRADAHQAVAYHIQGINDLNGNGGNWRVTADLFKADAPARQKPHHYRIFNGVREYPKAVAYSLMPFDTVSVNGFFRSQPDVNDAISAAAAKKGAWGYFIVRQVDANRGGNQFITAFIYKKDAAKRQVQATSDMIPADSEAGKKAITSGATAASKVAIPGVASSDSAPANVGRFFETQDSTGRRYTVTLPDGRTIQEVNVVTAAQMQPFTSITFTGHFATPTELSHAVAKRAINKGAKYYHITRQWQNRSGGNITITADLFR